MRTDAVAAWLARPAVQARIDALRQGQEAWLAAGRRGSFVSGSYVLLHTLAHLLIQSLAMRCGYPASSIRERIYVDEQAEAPRYGILLYTGTPDAEGTLGRPCRTGPLRRGPSGRRPADECVVLQ